MNYKTRMNLSRGVIYILLVFLMIITILPIWLLLVRQVQTAKR